MIVGIGCDIVEHTIAKSLNWENDTSILNRIFSKKELEIYLSIHDHQFLSGRFAAKEAVLKCLATGMQDGIALSEIQILQLLNGYPTIELLGTVKKISINMGINMWHISITQTDNYSFALVVAEKILLS